MVDIVISEFMDEGAVDALRSVTTVEYNPTLVDRQEDLAGLVKDARALIVRNRTQVREEMLGAAPRLQCVGRLGVGLDNIDVDACKHRGIAVYPATGANDLSVAEYVMTSAMALMRSAYLSNAEMIAGKWPRQKLSGREIAGKTMGLIGFGSIAREVAWRAQAYGMQIVAHDPYVDAADPVWQAARNLSLDGVLETADVVSLHVPLTDATRHMINADRLKSMRQGSVLINAARGGVVDETALASSLKDGHLGGAALDVFESEPLSAEAAAKFADIPNLILTPHIAGVTVESNKRVSFMIAELVKNHLEKSDG